MSSTTKNTTKSTITPFLVKLGKMGVENGKLYIQMKKDKKLLKKNQKKAYNALLKETQKLEKEAEKNKKMAIKVLPGVLKKHSKNIKDKQKAEKLKKKAIKVINVVLKKRSKNIDGKGVQNAKNKVASTKKKVVSIVEPVVEQPPAVVKPVVELSVVESPVVEQPPAVVKPVVELSVVESPVVEQPPVIEQPATVTDKYPRMTNTVGTANKFWEIVVNGTETCVTYGKVGTEGKSSKPKDHGFDSKAHAFAVKQVEIKSKGGYIATQDQ